ncbi:MULTISPECIES: hypothetical protein [Streptomyces]|uniref:hypothetical protein n=1 Tax=Streptomyces TaxID=1883 RepID=UPI0004CCC4DF|nr:MULTISPECIES: hypothetical protein [Streptomyces]KOT57091.1 hypothetical protein ADK43_21940 [Streptomyces rimosus subsp. rimosus]
MTEQTPAGPARPHGAVRSLLDRSLWGAGIGGLFVCYCIDLALRLYREHLAQPVGAPEVVPE